MISEKKLLDIAISHLSKVKEFDGYKKFSGVSCRDDFKKMMSNDPAFSALGLDDDRYIVARIGGNLITSLHRKIGDMYEGIFGYLLQEIYKIPHEDLHYSVPVKIGDRMQERSTDGLLRQEYMTDKFPPEWLRHDGVGFELRSCYQIGDSKRIQADYDMALALKDRNIHPVMLIFCTTSLQSPVARLTKSWELHEGMNAFNVINTITEFDLYAFLQDHRDELINVIDDILANF